MKIGVVLETSVSVSKKTNCQPAVVTLTKTLKKLGHESVILGSGLDLLAGLKEENPLVVFNLSGETGTVSPAYVPIFCDLLNVHYVGPDGPGLTLIQNKYATKLMVASLEAPVAAGAIISDLSELDHLLLPLPLFLKPLYGCGGMGIEGQPYVVNEDELYPAVADLLNRVNQPVLAEEFLEGREFVVGLWGTSPPDIIGIMERKWADNRPEPFIYSLEVRQDASTLVIFDCPASLDTDLATDIAGIARIAWRALDCRDLAIIDIKCNADGEPHFIEADALPDLTPNKGMLPIMAEKMGIAYVELIEGILKSALSRM